MDENSNFVLRRPPGDIKSLLDNVRKGHNRASSEVDFRELTKWDAHEALVGELSQLLKTCPPGQEMGFKKELEGFEKLFARFLKETGPSVRWENIQALPEQAMVSYQSLQTPAPSEAKQFLQRLVVVKLNGGLGTSMGCEGPKSMISVRGGLNFLDMTVQQIEHLNREYDVDVPLVLMNSFNTDEDTQQAIKKYMGFKVHIHTFNQSRYLRINRETLLPITSTLTTGNMEVFYPPGHGDFYKAFYDSGLLQRFIDAGKDYCFISNIDNMGATVDLNILSLLMCKSEGVATPPEFVMEVTDKTRADVKGGTLIQYQDKLRLLEIAQVPKDHVDEFKSVKKFRIFNTNNLWVNLAAIKRTTESSTLSMEIIVNHKTLGNGINVIQLETAAGAAIKSFDGALGINVPRRRFLPVKKTSDLLLVMSNLYRMQAGSLNMSPLRSFPSVPLVKLGDNHFSKVREFLARFASIPDLLELDHLTVSGDVTFGKGVILKGTVIIIANHGDRIDIPPGAILENKIVSGNLRILDH